MDVMHVPVKGLLFDFDNTLVPSKGADFDAIEKVKNKLSYHLSQEETETVINGYLRLLAIASVDPIGNVDPHKWRTNLWQQAIDLLSKNGEKLSAADLYSHWRVFRLEGMLLTPNISEVLRELRRNYKMAIVTNSDPIIQREKLKVSGVEKYFNVIIISGEEPESKPHSSIFYTACSKIDVRPEDCVMIGDNLQHDIQGGLNAGLRATVWVRGEGRDIQYLKPDDPKADFIVGSVLELPEVLATLGADNDVIRD